jgi:hypothetical protein
MSSAPSCSYESESFIPCQCTVVQQKLVGCHARGGAVVVDADGGIVAQEEVKAYLIHEHVS